MAALHGSDLVEPVALLFNWSGLPSYDRLYAVARDIAAAVAAGTGMDSGLPLLIVTWGRPSAESWSRTPGSTGRCSPLTGSTLKELDFIDIGELLTPPGVVPVVIKSLLFSLARGPDRDDAPHAGIRVHHRAGSLTRI